MRNFNPTTERPLPPHANHSSTEVEARLTAADEAFRNWRTTALAERASGLQRVAQVLRSQAVKYIGLMAEEMGKPLSDGEAEIEKCAACCEFFADHAAAMLAPEPIPSDATRSYVRYDPLGPVLAIMPWNFPFWQFFRFAAPAIMAGNTAILKHAPNVPKCAEAIEALFQEAGLPPGLVVNIRVDNATAESLIKHPLVRAVTLTGSDRAGRAVAGVAASVLKKSVLELGGSDPFLVLADADPVAAAASAAVARCINSGQSCIAAKRFIVDASVAEGFETALVNKMDAFRLGDPLDPSTQLGPLAREDLLINLHEQVDRTVFAGAKLLTGGRRLPRTGWFYAPTVLADVRPGMAAFDEETFGPVAAVVRAEGVDEIVRLANLCRYGLGASVWTGDRAAAERLAGDLEAGCVFVNGGVKSDPRLPFGGIKASGWGRELSTIGIREFTNVKTVWVK